MLACRKTIEWFTVYDPLYNFFADIRDVTIAGKGLQNVELFSALRAFVYGGILIVPHLLWHESSYVELLQEFLNL
jgi:hypothetical protein